MEGRGRREDRGGVEGLRGGDWGHGDGGGVRGGNKGGIGDNVL